MHLNAIAIYDKYALPRMPTQGKCLEVGPSRMPSPFFERRGNLEWWCCDIKARRLKLSCRGLDVHQIAMNELHIEDEDGKFDAIVNCHTIAHVRRPWLWVKELARVLKPGGVLVTISAVCFKLGPMPYDCWRVMPHGLRVLYEDAGIEVVDLAMERLCEGTAGERNWQFGHIDPIDAIAVGVKRAQ